jgi:hypothetical protein
MTPIKTLLTASVLASIILPAHASILSVPFIKHELVESATSADPTNANEHLYARMLSSKGAAKSIFSVWSSYSDQSVIGARWGEVGLNLLRWSDPERTHDWKTSRRVVGIPQLVYQQDSLVDLERVEYRYDGYPVRNVAGYELADTTRPNRQFPKTSERLLAEGQAPIGPDNRPVVICRIGTSEQAPYVELSEKQRSLYSTNTGMSFASCLSGAPASAYWKARYSDFIDKYHDRRPRGSSGELK